MNKILLAIVILMGILAIGYIDGCTHETEALYSLYSRNETLDNFRSEYDLRGNKNTKEVQEPKTVRLLKKRELTFTIKNAPHRKIIKKKKGGVDSKNCIIGMSNNINTPTCGYIQYHLS